MQDISTGNHQPKSKTVMLPIIDLNPNDETCVHSVLLFAIEQSKKLNVKEPSITFDQPLWFKALEIITSSWWLSYVDVLLWKYRNDYARLWH